MGCGLWTLKACPQLSCCTRGNWLIPGGAAPPGAARSQLSKHGVQKLGNVVMTEGQSFFLEHLLVKDPLTSQSPTQPGHPLRAGQNLSPHCSRSLCHCVWSCPRAAVSLSTPGASGKEGASISSDCPPSVHPRPGTKLAPAGAWGIAENPALSPPAFPLPGENPSSHPTIFTKAVMAR